MFGSFSIRFLTSLIFFLDATFRGRPQIGLKATVPRASNLARIRVMVVDVMNPFLHEVMASYDLVFSSLLCVKCANAPFQPETDFQVCALSNRNQV